MFSCSSTLPRDGERVLRAATLCSTACVGQAMGLSSCHGAGQVSAPSAACPSLGSIVGTWWSCGGWERWCLPPGVLRDATWSGHLSPGKVQLVGVVSSPPAREGASLGNAGAGARTKHPDEPVLPHGQALSRSQPAQWELSVLPSPSLLAVPRSQVRTPPLFAFFKINHFGGEFHAIEQCQPDCGSDYKGSVIHGRHPVLPKASHRQSSSLGC